MKILLPFQDPYDNPLDHPIVSGGTEMFCKSLTENFDVEVYQIPYIKPENSSHKDKQKTQQDIINKADSAIKTNIHGSSIRFGHDGNIIPLAMLLHIDNAYASATNPLDYYIHWRDFEVAPMAANLQIIFFRSKKSTEILVKFVYNEKEVRIPEIYSNILPFYRWKDVSSYYSSFLNDTQ